MLHCKVFRKRYVQVGCRISPMSMVLLVTVLSTSRYFKDNACLVAPSTDQKQKQLVLADGSLVTANATHNSDLWFVMKAGQ